MKCEIVAIGDELLFGLTLNTNAFFLSQQLCALGWEVVRHTTLPDDPELLYKGLQDSLERSDVVIATGGLGPTCDDHTRTVAAKLFGGDLCRDKTVAEDLKRRFTDAFSTLQNQVMVPAGARVFLNAVGTAPGFALTKQRKCLLLLPGPPQEMEPMFMTSVLPFLKAQYPLSDQKKRVRLHLCLLNEREVDPLLRTLQQQLPEVQCGIYPSYSFLTLLLTSHSEASLKKAEERIRTAFPHKLFSSSEEKLEEVLRCWFSTHKKTLCLAESCTGGMLAARLTACPGASEYFLGSFVTYSNALKHTLLAVSEKTLATHGAVSRETVLAMLEGVFSHSRADFAIAVSGIAGPTGGTPDKPVGTVWAAIGERGKAVDIDCLHLTGNRETILLKTSGYLLGVLWRKVAHGIPAFPL